MVRPRTGIPGFDEAMRANDASVAQRTNAYEAATRQKVSDSKRNFWTSAIKMGLSFAALPVAGAVMGGGGTLGSMAGNSATSAGTGGVAASGLSRWLPWLKAGELAAGTFGNIYGANKASTANRDALAAEKLAGDQAYQMALADRDESKRQFDIQQAAMQADLTARNKFESDRWAASEEERLYDRRLKDERETRLAPYRAASADALARLPGVLDRGRATPGMGTFGSFRR